MYLGWGIIFSSFFNYSYGLLGASGCGKTTVLSTIVGLKSLNQGIVEVFGGIPGDRKLGIPGNRIGYMPQVCTCFKNFDIIFLFGIYFLKRRYFLNQNILISGNSFIWWIYNSRNIALFWTNSWNAEEGH